MAKRRMFSESVVENDFFLDLPLTTQALYFHIGMRADDDGICASAKTVMRIVGANQNDMDLLIAKKFIIPMDDGVIVVKHWRVNNYLQRDGKHYQGSEYDEIKAKLYVKKNRIYTIHPEKGIPLIPMDKKCIQNFSTDKIRVEESRLDKNRLGEEIKDIDDVCCNPKGDSKGEDLQQRINERVKRMREERYGK